MAKTVHTKIRAFDGEEKRFLEMLSRSQHIIFEICLHFTDRKSESIRDLYQEIACTLWEAWPNCRNKSFTDTWVRRIALNVAVTEIRSHSKHPRFVPLEESMYLSIADEIDKAPPDYFRLVDYLKPDERALIYLRLERLSLSAIAEILATTEAAVKQRLYRLRKKIDTIKKQQEYEDN